VVTISGRGRGVINPPLPVCLVRARFWEVWLCEEGVQRWEKQ